MKLPRLSVGRPVLTTMVTLIVVVLGAVALGRLQIDLLPDVELPRLSIRTGYEGASPEVVERLVTQIVEEIAGTVPGIEEITSTSSEGRSEVRLTLTPGTDIDTAAIELQGRLEDEINEFPEDIERPTVRKFDIGSFPVVIVGIASDLNPVELTQLLETQIRQRFGRVPGVAQIDPWGGYDREVHVDVDPAKMQALGLAFNDIVSAVTQNNVDLPVGTIQAGRYEPTLRAPAEFQDVESMRRQVVAVREGAAVTLGQIAAVEDTYATLTRYVRINGKRGLRLAIRKESDANTVEVANGILKEIEAINRDFPQVQIQAISNQGNFIERSIANVAKSVLYGGVLAVFVLLFFLRNVRSTTVIAVAIPISILATLAVMYLFGLTINLMTLGGLALGVGMMVDSSIVVLENIYRRRQELRDEASTAAIEGTSEVGGAIIASTITTLVIFLPLVFVRGVSGMLFKEFAFVVVISLVCSLFVALTLVPVLASRMLRPSRATEGSGSRGPKLWRQFVINAGRSVEALENQYRLLLRWCLNHRWLTVLSATALLAASLPLITLIGAEFMPPSDEGEVNIRGEMEIATRLDLVDRQADKLEAKVIDAVPEIDARIMSVSDQARLDLTLLPATQRSRSNQEIADDLRAKIENSVPGMRIRTSAPQGQNLLNRILPNGSGLSIEIRGFDLDVIEQLVQRVSAAVADVPGVEEVDPGRREGVPQERFHIDREKVADVGLSVSDVSAALETAVSGRRAGEFRAEGVSYPIRVQLKDARQLPLSEILQLTLRTPNGDQVALNNLVSTEAGRGPREISRKNRQRLARVNLELGDRDTGSIAEDLQVRLAAIARPEGYELEVAGSYEEQKESSRELQLSIVLALLLVYMVLASQYESLRDPLVVMLSVPMAAVGVLITLFLTETTLNVQSYIGCIMLAGIVVNNAILLVDQAGHLRVHDHLSPREAVLEAGRRRLRPILMTSATTMLGLLPLAFGIGEGADAQAPLARAVIGGLLASMLITLLVVPVAYTLVHPHKPMSSGVAA